MPRSKRNRIIKADLPQELVKVMVDMAFNPMSWGDGYTMNAMRDKYSQEMISAVSKLIIEPMREERKSHEKALEKITKKYTHA